MIKGRTSAPHSALPVFPWMRPDRRILAGQASNHNYLSRCSSGPPSGEHHSGDYRILCPSWLDDRDKIACGAAAYLYTLASPKRINMIQRTSAHAFSLQSPKVALRENRVRWAAYRTASTFS